MALEPNSCRYPAMSNESKAEYGLDFYREVR